jgi:hypothetical protein
MARPSAARPRLGCNLQGFCSCCQSFIARCLPFAGSAAILHPGILSAPDGTLVLPTPNDVRTGSGRPGAHYWQQEADYRIAATLDPARNQLTGRETIHYTNHSPDTLPYLWMFLEQNLCAPGSITNTLNQPPLKFLDSEFDFSCQGFNGGLALESVRIGGREGARHLRHHHAHRPGATARARCLGGH